MDVKRISAIGCFVVGLGLTGCAAGVRLESRVAEPQPVGSFTAILYGAGHGTDLETAAFLDVEGDEYTLKPAGSKDNFTVSEHLSGWQALTEARKFVSFHPSFTRIEQQEILGPDGRVIGYAVKPLYYPQDFGTDDVLEIDYRLQPDQTVLIHIRLKDLVEKRVYYPGP